MTKTYEQPEYRESNPKIDLYGKGGGYIASTNWHRTCKNALAYYRDNKPEWNITRAVRSKK